MDDFKDDILDDRFDITPEDLRPYYPPIFKRFIHLVVDSTIFYFLAAIITLIVFPKYYEPIDIAPRALLLYYFTYVVSWFVFEYVFQRTPGKFLTGTKVVAIDGTKPTIKAILIRTLCRFIPFEFISYLGSNKFGMHDSISKTRVVNKDYNF